MVQDRSAGETPRKLKNENHSHFYNDCFIDRQLRRANYGVAANECASRQRTNTHSSCYWAYGLCA